jgi:glycolate oxidase
MLHRAAMKAIDTVIEQLREILPGCLVLDPEVLETYARDETIDLCALPACVVRAQSAQDVSAVLKLCNEHGVPVTPRGAGTGVTGGAVAVSGGIVLSLEKLNRILEIDARNLIAVVEPCAITADIQKAALQHRLMYPPDPASLETCSIGGNVAENAGGPRAVKYGITGHYVIGLEFVLADGSIISSGGKYVKNATGYNICGILTGSEGTLAVITKIYLRLVPAPACSIDLLMPFVDMSAAVGAVSALLQSGIVPATIEFMEQDAIAFVAAHLGQDMPCADAGAHLLLQVEGPTEQACHESLAAIAAACAIDAETIIVAQTVMQQERLWKGRRSIREALRQESPVLLAEDCVVPRAEIAQFLAGLKEYLGTLSLRSVMFGHAGDGNVHIDVLKDAMSVEQWQALLPGLKREIYRRAIKHGGTITGEHGIGCIRRDYLAMAKSPEEIALYRRIKHAFDPRGIINPGKIF